MCVANKPLEPREKLLYLKEYTGTKVHTLITWVEFLSSNDAFVVALKKLDTTYGDDVYATEARAGLRRRQTRQPLRASD